MMLQKLFGCELRYVEYVLASISLWWGVWLIFPWQTFASTPTFAVANGIAPEWIWGVTLMIGGVALIIGLRLESYPLRRRSLLILSLLWLAVWGALLFGNWRGTSTVVYVHMASLCGFAYLRLSNRAVGS